MSTVAPSFTALYPPGVTSGLEPAAGTMLAAWRRTVRVDPERPAVHYFHGTVSFGQIDRASDALAAAFRWVGVGPGDRVAAYLQNDPQWLVCLLAAWKCNAAVVCLNPMYRQHELRHHIGDAAPRVLICLDRLYAEVIAPIRDDLALEAVITTAPWDMMGALPPPSEFAGAWGRRQTFPSTLDWLELQRRFASAALASVDVRPEDTALLTYTSGTTGRSKGAVIVHGAMAHSSQVYASWFEIGPRTDVVLGLAPLFHITGSVAGLGVTIMTGAPIVLLHRFDTVVTLDAIERCRPTFAVAASTAFLALSGHPTAMVRDLSSLTKAASGGAPLTRAVIDRVKELTGWSLLGVYGMTETTSPVTLSPPGVRPPDDPERGVVAVGIPVPAADVRIVDVDSGQPVPAGSAGEVTVAGPMVSPGYWNAPQETAHAIRDGHLYTGDVGILTQDGWLFVVDRKKDLINAGGYKIWPREVEEAIYRHPAVREAAVIGVPDEYRGETVKAYVSLNSGHTMTPRELIDFCKKEMAAYKYPRLVEILDELPKNVAGKILRRELRPSGIGKTL